MIRALLHFLVPVQEVASPISLLRGLRGDADPLEPAHRPMQARRFDPCLSCGVLVSGAHTCQQPAAPSAPSNVVPLRSAAGGR